MLGHSDPTTSEQYQSLKKDHDEVVATVDDYKTAVAKAEKDRDDAIDQMKRDIATREADLTVREAAAKLAEDAVAAREAAVTTTEQQIADAQIHDGTWTVGVDIAPGTYRTIEPVSGTCYWAIYKSGTNKDDIVQNDIVNGGYPTVTIREGQDFESSRCGTWAPQ
ncbi:hypothetical protein [Cellulomonas iranensis]|uniref:hypothetical protein n=1 Tax=Cellulomonas iranensis TaxID=76862 RepID=UPI0015C62A18|nr:hypothetical protein [Cellulomonas iranensis]